MESTTHTLSRRWTALRDELRDSREARAARRSLAGDLATYTSPDHAARLRPRSWLSFPVQREAQPRSRRLWRSGRPSCGGGRSAARSYDGRAR